MIQKHLALGSYFEIDEKIFLVDIIAAEASLKKFVLLSYSSAVTLLPIDLVASTLIKADYAG